MSHLKVIDGKNVQCVSKIKFIVISAVKQ